MSRETVSVLPGASLERSVARDDLTPARYRLLVSPAVLSALGGEQAVRSGFAGMSPAYRCACCGNEGRLDRGQMASLVVVVNEDSDEEDTPQEPRLAHPGCSDSQVRLAPATPPNSGYPALPGAVWLRPADTDPAAVVVLTVRLSSAHDLWADEKVPTLSSTLSAHGFVTLTSMEARFPRSQSLTAWYAAGRVSIQDRFGRLVWSGQLPASQPWAFAALRARDIGLVLAAVEPSDAGQESDLAEAVAAGHAMGVSVRLRDPGVVGELLPTRRASTLGVRQFRLPTQRTRISEHTRDLGLLPAPAPASAA